jgi:hypothetical protein
MTQVNRYPYAGRAVAVLQDARPEVRKALKRIVLFACVEKQGAFFGEAFAHIIPNTEDNQRGWMVLAKLGVPPDLIVAYDQQNWSFVRLLHGVAMSGIEHGRLGNSPSGT